MGVYESVQIRGEEAGETGEVGMVDVAMTRGKKKNVTCLLLHLPIRFNLHAFAIRTNAVHTRGVSENEDTVDTHLARDFAAWDLQGVLFLRPDMHAWQKGNQFFCCG